MNAHAILIFDQEEAVRDSLQIVLSEEGYQCFSTSSKASALKLLQDEPIGMVIMDSGFSELNGMLQNIKEVVPYLKVVLISSYAESEITQQALSYGADDFVLKPLDFDELISRIHKLLVPAAG